ncbi:outer membrane lipoprotein-sorting protein [Alkalimonas delamerensis]|uniref:Outer membrane lipoprotein-sorting protein n=1 Tax=Alkalimonas delamerensis TaxID=265981 RepID=A0ABT9GSL4_9GAMM|nr:outer membrane lipoprotein-sorting protein [Alkalimonas delamerensis]MDP4529980.1 outer membrane lipoprotein-sorting protein [Alkalimonas delamerensis]
MRQYLPTMLLSLTLAALCLPLQANDQASEEGLRIATERKVRDTGWGDTEAHMTMILRDARGRESRREMRTLTLEVLDDGDKALTIFDEPRDVRGSAFLTHTKTLVPDEQWLFLPAVNRVRRIVSRNKSGPFMGSEFSYEDLSSFELEKFRFKYLHDDEVHGEPSYVVEQTPLDEFSGYSRMLVWIDKSHYRVQQIEYYDRRGALLKTLTMHDYQVHQERFWRPHRMEMVNAQNQKSTTLLLNEILFERGFTDADFDQNALQRAR